MAIEVKEAADHGTWNLKSVIDNLPVRQLAMSSLVPGPYLRQSGTNAAHVLLIAGVANAADLPPILVQERGRRIIDGMHRLEAARLRGERDIRAYLLDCTDEQALVLAIKSNSLHGLPLSRADRMMGAKRVLAAHPDWSDRAIAAIAGLSPKTIGSIRSRSSIGLSIQAKRLGRDGRRRPVAPAESRRRASEYISAHPEASLREVAREADVSVSTAHSICKLIGGRANPAAGRPGQDRGPQPAPCPIQAAQGPPDLSAAPVRAAGGLTGRGTAVVTPLAWSVMAAKLAHDPAIRYTDGGKIFLRWMALHAARPDEWREFVDVVPLHWLSVIAPLADRISQEWGQFAKQLRRRQEMAS